MSSSPPLLAPGVGGNSRGSYAFRGSREDPSNYIKLPNMGSLDTRYSVSLFAWIFPESRSGEFMYYWSNSDAGVGLSLEDSYVVLDLYSRDQPKRRRTFEGFSLSLNTWHHVGATYDNVTNLAHIWVNGTIVVNGTVENGGSPFLLRTQYDLWVGFLFTGRITQVRIYNVPLTANDVMAIKDFWPDISE